ncbi:MAG: GNVR domain-containing protein [Candidatus Sulfotelmatobacter sp.]
MEAAARLEGELIAAESELEGLEQIYTKDNVRVRSLQARVDELRSQLHQIGGDTADPTGGKPGSAQELPSIRQLPLLGVRWADLYRETKIQETVYEMLTQQYELAKIEEAKEIPVVKVLDIADVPEKKSFPPRLLIVALGAAFSVALGALVVVGSRVWGSIDPRSPQKQLLTEIWLHAKARIRSVRSPEFDPRPSAGKGNGTPRF